MGKPTMRQRAPPRQSLAATHPARYAQATNQAMLPPPMPATVRKTDSSQPHAQAPSKRSRRDSGVAYPTPSPSLSPKDASRDYIPPKQPKNRQATRSSVPRRSNSSTLRLSHNDALTASASSKGSPRLEVLKPKRPWEEHSDPTFTTSDIPVEWGDRNGTVLKSDTDMSFGVTISPTYMLGLPFGSMTEVAHHYKSEERLKDLR